MVSVGAMGVASASICLDVLEAMEVDWQGSDVDGPKLF